MTNEQIEQAIRVLCYKVACNSGPYIDGTSKDSMRFFRQRVAEIEVELLAECGLSPKDKEDKDGN